MISYPAFVLSSFSTPLTHAPQYLFFRPFQDSSSVVILLYLCVGEFICGVCFVLSCFFFFFCFFCFFCCCCCCCFSPHLRLMPQKGCASWLSHYSEYFRLYVAANWFTLKEDNSIKIVLFLNSILSLVSSVATIRCNGLDYKFSHHKLRPSLYNKNIASSFKWH